MDMQSRRIGKLFTVKLINALKRKKIRALEQAKQAIVDGKITEATELITKARQLNQKIKEIQDATN